MTEVIEKTEYKKGYKKTKLGWIPEDWDIVHLDSICDVRDGTHDSPKYYNYGIPFLTSKNLTENGLDFYNVNYISEEDHKKFSERSKVENGDILFGMIGTIGNPTIVNTTINFSIKNMALIKFFKDTKINNFYLLNIIKSKIISNQFSKTANEGVQSFISLRKIRKLLIPLPLKEEQEKIAEILSAWDEGIETLEKLIEQKEIFHKALMKNLLIGKIRLFGFSKNSEYKRTKLGSIPVDWQIKPLKLLFDKRMQKYSRDTEHNIFTNSATKGVVLQNEYFDRSIVTEENTSNYYVVGEDDFMYNPRISQNAPAGPINRNKLGITGIASPLYTIFKAKHDTIVDFYEQYFISNLWNNSMFMVANQGARHDRLNITNNDFMNMPLPYPPLKEQEKIANVLIESYKEIQILNSKLEKLKEQKKGLMQKLLTGQIRVKV